MEKSCWHARTSMVRTSGTMGEHHAGCSKRPSSKAAASEEARRTLRYVEPLSAAKTPLADFFSILLEEGGHDEVNDVGGPVRALLDMEHCGLRQGIIAS